jgi:hypothetical protein
MLAAFINRQPKASRRSRSASQPPHQPVNHQTVSEPILWIPNPDITQPNRPQPAAPPINRFYDQNPSPDRPDVFQDLSDPHTTPSQEGKLHPYYPENLYISSVLPTRTPKDLRHFQAHCWNIFHARPRSNFIHGLDESRNITTSPLHFENLLWRYAIILHDQGITEEYYWIKRDRKRHRPDRPRLEPAYAVNYPWTGTAWTTAQLDRLQRNLPQTPVE